MGGFRDYSSFHVPFGQSASLSGFPTMGLGFSGTIIEPAYDLHAAGVV